MAINLGTAFVDVVPSTKNLGPQMRQQVVPAATAAGAAGGDAAGRGFGSRFASSVSNFIGGVGQTIERTLGAAAVAAGGLAATTLFKGWDRLTTIQNATASLTVILGDAGQAASLLDEVLNVVRGTPFNLDQFASATQRLVGMGVEAKKIPGYLTAIGEASALQGKDANQYVDRLVRVFGQIKAQGRVTGEDINQISETGVNALKILGNAFGVSSEEMRDMISNGVVPADKALDALAKGIVNGSTGVAGATVALGGNMASLRKTLTGAAGGIGAALARVGAAFLTPFTPALTDVFNGVTDFLDQITPKAKAFATAVVESEGFNAFLGFLKTLPDLGPRAMSTLAGLGDALGPLAGLVASFASKGLGSLPLIGQFIPVIGPFVGIIGGIIAQSPELREKLVPLGESLVRLGTAVLDAFTPIIDKVVPVIETILGLGLDGATSVVNYIAGLVEAFNTAGLEGVFDKIGDDWAQAGPVLREGLDTAWGSVTGWVAETTNGQEGGFLDGLADDALTGFDLALNGNGSGSSPINQSLDDFAGTVESKIGSTGNGFHEAVANSWPEAFTGWVDEVVNGDNGLTSRLQTITDSIDQWIDNGGIQAVLAAGGRLGLALFEGWILTIVPGILKVISGLAAALFKALGSIAWMFVQMGTSIAAQIAKGMADFFRDKLGDVVGGAAIAGLKSIPVLGSFITVGEALTGKAGGGPVLGGTPYIVGEKGPEIFVPEVSGTIVPNHQLSSWRPPDVEPPAPAAPSRGGDTYITYAPSTDARDIVREQRRAARKQAVFAGGIGG